MILIRQHFWGGTFRVDIANTTKIEFCPALSAPGGSENPPAVEAGNVIISVKNVQGTSAAYYKVGDSGEFIKISENPLTLSSSSDLKDVTSNTKIYFKADIDSSQVLDKNNQNWYRVGDAETRFVLTDLENGLAYIEYDPNNTYNVQIAFDGGNGGGEQQDVSFSCSSMNGNENERVNAVEVQMQGSSDWVAYSSGVLNSLTERGTFKVRITMKEGFTIDRVSLDYESFDHTTRAGYFKESDQPNYDAIIAELLSPEGYAITFQPEEASKNADGKSTLDDVSTCLCLQYQTAIAYNGSVGINWFFQTKDGDNGYGVWTRDSNGDDVFVDGVGDSEVIFSFNDNNYGENGNPFDLGFGKRNDGESPIQVSYDSAYKNVTGKVTVTPDTYDYFSAGGYKSGDVNNTIHIDDFDGLIDEVYIDRDGDNYFEASEKLTAKTGNDPHIGKYSYYEETLATAASYNILVRKHLSTRVSLKWSYTETGTDFYVDHGKIFIEKVVRGDETLYQAQVDSNGDLVLDEQGVPSTTTNSLGRDYGVSPSAGEVFLECGDEVTIRLIPTYGYQIESATLNGVVQLTPNATVSSFTFTVGGNLHMAGTFVESTDVTDTTGATKIKDAGITDGQNATDSGNLKLTVEDHSGNYAKEREALNLAKGENANATTIATLDMTLDSMVSKGNGQYWTDNITSFGDDITVNLELNDTTYVSGDTYVVVREHDGELQKLTTNYNNGMLEVPTNRFSTYSIVKIPVAEENRPNMYLGYDPRGEGAEAGSVTVKCNGSELTGTNGYYKYSDPAQAITFELTRPKDRTDTTPVVEVVFPRENADPVVIYPTLTGDKFTVTPGTDSGLTGSPFMEVYVHWSAYDKVGPDEDQFMVILRKYSDEDSFVFQNNPTIINNDSLDGETKYIFANGTNVSVEIQPGENRELVEVYVDISGQLTHYSAEPQEGDRNIAELKTSDGKFVVPNLAPWTMVEAICIDLPVLSNIRLTDTSQTLYDTMKRSEVGISATCKLGGVELQGTVELDGGNELLTVGENEYKVVFTSDLNELGERLTAEGTITLKVLHKVDISGLGWTGTTFTYNGTAQGPTFSSNLPEIRVSSTRDNSKVDAGSYTAVASITLAEGLSREYYKLVNLSGTTGITIIEGGAIATVTKQFTIEKATLTPTLSGTTTKVYDDTTAVTATNTLTLAVDGLKNSETVTVTATSYAYDNVNVGTGKTITASGISISGDAAKNYVLSGTTATVASGEITKATPTIMLSNLSETTQAPAGVKATLSPSDATAIVKIEYEVLEKAAVAAKPEVPCNVTHDDTCASKDDGKTIADCNCSVSHKTHTVECGYQAATVAQAATYKWVETRPAAPGTYKVRAYLPNATANLEAVGEGNAVTGIYILTKYTASSGGGSNSNAGTGSGSSSGNTSLDTTNTNAPVLVETITATTPKTETKTQTKPATRNEQTTTETTTETEKPIGVSSTDGSEGWTDIKTEIADKLKEATETVEVVVEMNGEDTVPAEIFESIKGQDVTVSFDMGNGIVWAVNGMDITGDNLESINLSATTGSGVTVIPTELISSLGEDRFTIELTLEHEGEFGFTAVMTVNVDQKNAGKFANLFYFNPTDEAMEFICSAPVNEDGTAELAFVHASDYVIVVDEVSMSEEHNISLANVRETASEETPEEVVIAENDSWNPIWIIVIGAAIIVIGGIVVFITKKKHD